MRKLNKIYWRDFQQTIVSIFTYILFFSIYQVLLKTPGRVARRGNKTTQSNISDKIR